MSFCVWKAKVFDLCVFLLNSALLSVCFCVCVCKIKSLTWVLGGLCFPLSSPLLSECFCVCKAKAFDLGVWCVCVYLYASLSVCFCVCVCEVTLTVCVFLRQKQKHLTWVCVCVFLFMQCALPAHLSSETVRKSLALRLPGQPHSHCICCTLHCI